MLGRGSDGFVLEHYQAAWRCGFLELLTKFRSVVSAGHLQSDQRHGTWLGAHEYQSHKWQSLVVFSPNALFTPDTSDTFLNTCINLGFDVTDCSASDVGRNSFSPRTNRHETFKT